MKSARPTSVPQGHHQTASDRGRTRFRARFRASVISHFHCPDRRERNGRIAALQRDLVYLAHILEKAKVAVMDEYHAMRGKTAHLEGEDE
jgi:hypothetical protein